MTRRQFISALFLVWLCPCLALAQDWQFDVSMDGKAIGTHAFVLDAKEDGQLALKSEAKFNVTFLSISVFKYHHVANEVWQNDCLKKLEAKTQENSKATVVGGTQDKAMFRLAAPTPLEISQQCVMTFAYWNPKILQQKKLLNPQTGEYLNAQISALGQETILAKGQAVKAERYKINTNKFVIDLWYGLDGEWLALQSTTPDGRIDYALK
ncbi:MAG: DUF6134 family protein [Methylotenera sp.]|nr:DUF6134 family protein [Methylotenera sp.]